MAAILPLICWILIFLAIGSNQQDWQKTYLTSLLIWGVILTGLTECLSFFQILNFQWLFLSWLLLSLGIATFYYRKILRSLTKISKKRPVRFSWSRVLPLFRFNSVLVLTCLVFVLTVGFLAVYAAPNNWDSMIYHLSRVVYWQQASQCCPLSDSYTQPTLSKSLGRICHSAFANFKSRRSPGQLSSMGSNGQQFNRYFVNYQAIGRKNQSPDLRSYFLPYPADGDLTSFQHPK